MSVTLGWRLDFTTWRAGVSGVRSRLADLSPALRAIARAGVASTRRRFQTSQAPDGTPWVKGKKKRGLLLILSGLLLRSISDRPPEQAAVEWGSNRAYAGVQQAGFNGVVQVSPHTRVVSKIFGRRTKTPVVQSVRGHSRKMANPARPYLGISIDDRRNFPAILLAHVAQPLTGGAEPTGDFG